MRVHAKITTLPENHHICAIISLYDGRMSIANTLAFYIYELMSKNKQSRTGKQGRQALPVKREAQGVKRASYVRECFYEIRFTRYEIRYG
jgi:hypothetical protein